MVSILSRPCEHYPYIEKWDMRFHRPETSILKTHRWGEEPQPSSFIHSLSESHIFSKFLCIIYCSLTITFKLRAGNNCEHYHTISWGGNSRADQLACSDLGSSLGLQSRCQLGLQSSVSQTGTGVSSRWLTHMAGRPVLVVGRRPQFLAMWTST